MHLIFRFALEADPASKLRLKAEINTREHNSLLDLHEGMRQLGMDINRLIVCFEHYLALEGKSITGAIAGNACWKS
jgi:hypothetical protein